MNKQGNNTGNSSDRPVMTIPPLNGTEKTESKEFKAIVFRMCKECSGLSHGYRSSLENLYVALTKNYGYAEPIEGMSACVDKTLSILNNV